MNYEIFGRVVEAETKRGVSGVAVSAFDRDPLFDDPLGEVLCDADGRFRIVYDERSFRDLFEKAPDVYVMVKTLDGKVLYSSRDATRNDASVREEFQVELSRAVVDRVGLSASAPLPSGNVERSALTTLTCLAGAERDDLVKQIEADLAGKASVLEIFRGYMGALHVSPNNDALPFRKLARLFELGTTPDRVAGHHYGLVPGLRSGDLGRNAAEIGNAMGLIWGKVAGDITPWVGKTFTPLTGSEKRQLAPELAGALPAFRGINHFNVLERAPVNVAITSILDFLWGLRDASVAERLRYGYDKSGGHFVAHRARSIHPSTPREVFRLNYRYQALGNAWPLKYLIDEVVEIAAGLYLGQVLFATDHLLEPYDPRAPDERYHYQHFGYFLMLSEPWVPEARRLFPYLEIPEVAAATRIVGPLPALGVKEKFSTLTLAPAGDGNVDSVLLEQIKSDLGQAGSIIRLLKSYSETLEQELDARSPVFAKLATLFNAGVGPERMTGFYRGALVAWQSQGLLALGGVNNVQGAWLLGRQFSPWTGKRFDPIDAPLLLELSDGHEKGEAPTFFCANTVVFRTAKERFTGQLARALDLWIDAASDEERRLYGYDAKTFFFIGKAAPSIYAPNRGKRVFQFNYRWKKLRNPIPDRYCIDELVQIADGLYLGQVFYATNWLEPWDPGTALERYQYDLFEYFVVMDEEWHAERLRIGYDLVNV